MVYPQILCFKSLMDDIITTGDIESELGHPLCYQYGFKKHVSPFEKNEWHIFENHVNGFTIKPAMIDRVYHLYSNVKDDEYDHVQNYGLFCRMWHEGVPYFVAMRAQCGNCGFDCDHCAEGDILFCKSAYFFLQHMFCSYFNGNDYKEITDKIYLSLLQDGYRIPKPDHLYYISPKFRRNVPMLKFLCHEHIYENQEILSHFKYELPQVLVNSVNELIKCKNWDKNII